MTESFGWENESLENRRGDGSKMTLQMVLYQNWWVIHILNTWYV